MQGIYPFLVSLWDSNAVSFLVIFCGLLGFVIFLMWLEPRAERRYLREVSPDVLQAGDTPAAVDASGETHAHDCAPLQRSA